MRYAFKENLSQHSLIPSKAISIPIALFGYFVPYVHIGKFIVEKFPKNNQNLPLICIGLTSGVGRVIFGMISDLPKVFMLVKIRMSSCKNKFFDYR